MSAPCTEPPEPAAIRHEIGGTVVETVRRTDGWWLYRCPEILPVNARYWGHHTICTKLHAKGYRSGAERRSVTRLAS